MVAFKCPPENEEFNEKYKIEETIHDMLNKVMEEDDSFNSLDFGHEEIDDESLKISRISTRHQTTDFPFQNNFNRQNKRNLTEILNNKESNSSFNATSSSSNCPIVKKKSLFCQNNFNNNLFSSNVFQNSLQNNNLQNNALCFNNSNINSALPLLSFNNNITNNNNVIRNNLPYSKTVVVPNNKGNVFNDSQVLLNYINNKNNIQNIFNGNNNYNNYFSINVDSDNFKRKDNRKKTYDIHNTLQNNICNCLKNNNNINNNSLNDISLNNIDITNYDNHYKNKNNISIKDSFIYELKNILEKNGRIDYHVYYLIKGKFLSIIKNHKGSKLFQKYLKSTNPEEIIHLLYVELSQNLEEFITDAYSNYFCKKFFTFLSPQDRIDFLKKIENSIVKYSCDSIGTYPIQTIIENLNNNIEKFIIINAIKNNVEELVYNPFGCHVLEKLLSCLDEEYISFIYSYISDNFLSLANNANGICLVKKILTFTQKKNLHEKIKKIVKENAFNLIEHPYGNFVIQVIVECWDDYLEIINIYKNNFFNLSLEKYASNVIERFIEKDENILKEFIDEIINSNRIHDVMRSNYGNYVIQKAIKISKNENKKKLVFYAAKDINNLNENKLISKWKSLLLPHIKDLTSEQIQELKKQKYFGN